MPEKTAVAEAPELPEATPADSPEVEPKVSEETEASAPTEAAAEAEGEAEEPTEETPTEEGAEEPSVEDQIKGLDPTLREEIIRLGAGDSAHIKDLLGRERQSVTQSQASEQERLRGQQEDTDRVLQAGRTAIGQIGSIVAAAQKPSEDGEVKLDTQGLYRAIDDYRNAWVAGQGTTWNRELNEAFTGQDVVAATFGEPEAERLSTAMKAANRENSRAPLLKEMFGLLTEKSLEQGYRMALEDMGKIQKHQEVLKDKKDGLRDLKGAVPSKAPTEAAAVGSADSERLARLADGTGTTADKRWYKDKYGG